jgi:CLIP-associating protein 1/2
MATTSAIRVFVPRIAASETSGSCEALSSSTSSSTRSSQDLRLAIMAFLAGGGIVDRLGEQREPVRRTARETLVSIGVATVKHSLPSGPGGRKGERLESPYSLFEKYIKEVGFGSKVWRVREQVSVLIYTCTNAHAIFSRHSR